MEYDAMIADLFADEDRARRMARRLVALAQDDPEAAARERVDLLTFLEGPLEEHLAAEERTFFPLLVEHGLGAEVEVAVKQHTALRREIAQLRAADTTEAIALAMFFAARTMLHHTNFEADYIYPELSHEQWRQLMKAAVDRR